MDITAIPCLKDNYAYLLRAPGSTEGVVVDPSEAEPVERVLAEQGITLRGILCTHHHADHVGGNAGLRATYPNVPVFGYVSDRGRIPEQTNFLADGERFEIVGLSFRAIHIPGHTLGAVAYVGDGVVFTGDTLFIAGCGRLFEGTPEMMYESLNVKLGGLPDETRIYCGHEYTVSNLRFAAHVEPNNRDVQEKAKRAAALRERGEPTVPSNIAEERKTNPFMRCDSEEIQKSMAASLAGDRSPTSVLRALRAAKDVF